MILARKPSKRGRRIISNEKLRVEVARALRLVPPDEVAMDLAARYLTDASPDAFLVLRADLLGAPAVVALGTLAVDEHLAEELRRRTIELLGGSPRDDAAEALFAMIPAARRSARC